MIIYGGFIVPWFIVVSSACFDDSISRNRRDIVDAGNTWTLFINCTRSKDVQSTQGPIMINTFNLEKSAVKCMI